MFVDTSITLNIEYQIHAFLTFCSTKPLQHSRSLSLSARSAMKVNYPEAVSDNEAKHVNFEQICSCAGTPAKWGNFNNQTSKNAILSGT